ncbi:hypothetical protein Q8G35_22415 [Peribacillus simplex]|uniref:Uncharacterized protein n=2 Tax=Peribacillus TaxID=2675229 RepID=A0AA90T4L2_9BACI|nr:MULTISPECIES: YetF domain-containing protein [Peribacillus]MDP1421056.1 hypothetical protein [Peribacillus simplex]MDP1453823.1 hypothetical protein [Peribacillus frigoritolerans]
MSWKFHSVYKNIGIIKDVELAILQPNGQISTTLKPGKVPATKEDIYIILILFENTGAFEKAETPPLFKKVYDEVKDENFKSEDSKVNIELVNTISIHHSMRERALILI